MKFSIVLFASAVVAAPAGPAPATDPAKGTVDKLDNTLGGVDNQLTGVDTSVGKLDDQLGEFIKHGDITQAVTNLIDNQGNGLGGELNRLLGNKKLTVGMGSAISASVHPDFAAATKAATGILDQVTTSVKRQAVTDLASNSLFALLQALHLKLNTPVSSLYKRIEPAGDGDLEKILESVVQSYVSGINKDISGIAGQYTGGKRSEPAGDADLEKILESVVQAYVSGINKDISGIAGQYTGGKRAEQDSPDIAGSLLNGAPMQATAALKELSVILNNAVAQITKAGDMASSMEGSTAPASSMNDSSAPASSMDDSSAPDSN